MPRPSPANEIIDDVFVNMTHMRRYYPQSCALESPGTSPQNVSGRHNFNTFDSQLHRQRTIFKARLDGRRI